MNETVIKGSRTKILLLLVACLLFTAGGVYLVRDPDVDRTMAWLCTGFFGLGFVVSVVMLVLPNELILGQERFTVRALGRSFDVAWNDVERFHAWKNPYARQRLVAWSYRPGHAPVGPMAEMSAGLGAEGAMPGMMALSTDKLVDLMNQRLEASRR